MLLSFLHLLLLDPTLCFLTLTFDPRLFSFVSFIAAEVWFLSQEAILFSGPRHDLRPTTSHPLPHLPTRWNIQPLLFSILKHVQSRFLNYRIISTQCQCELFSVNELSSSHSYELGGRGGVHHKLFVREAVSHRKVWIRFNFFITALSVHMRVLYVLHHVSLSHWCSAGNHQCTQPPQSV